MWKRIRRWFGSDHRISRREAKRLAEQVGWDRHKVAAMVKYYEGERDRDRPA